MHLDRDGLEIFATGTIRIDGVQYVSLFMVLVEGFAMHVTYLIGNGFDLGIGLKTSYNDFLRHYCHVGENPVMESSAVATLKERIRKDDFAAWSDAEIAFAGLNLSQIVDVRSDREEAIDGLVTSFVDSMAKYLLREENKMVQVLQQEMGLCDMVRNQMLASVNSGLLDVSRTRKPNPVLQPSTDIEVNAINFNYTRAFDYFYSNKQIGSVSSAYVELNAGRKSHVTFNPPVHVHGTLSDKNALFGVSTVDQIKDGVAKSLAETTGLLIKERLDLYGQEGKYELATQFLKRSDVIVAFGLSFGASDKYWWRLLCELLIQNPALKVVIMPFDSNAQQLTSFGLIRIHNHRWRRKFIDSIWEEKSAAEQDQISRVLNRVLVNSYGPYLCRGEDCKMADPWNLSEIKKAIDSDPYLKS